MQHKNNNLNLPTSRLGTKRVLGSGLEDLLGANCCSNSNEIIDRIKNLEVKQVMIQNLIPGRFQPRRVFSDTELRELADSIVMHGVLQPILVRANSQNNYEIIAGERRWRAAKIAEIKQVPVVISNVTDQEALAFSIIENIQRQNLNPLEEAFSIKKLIDEFKLTHEKVSALLGKSRTSISNILRLTNLTKHVQELLISEQIEVGHAKILLAFDSEEQHELALKIIKNKMTVRTLEKFIKNKCNLRKTTQPKFSSNLDELQTILKNKFDREVILKFNNNGCGRLIININSIQDLENLIKRL